MPTIKKLHPTLKACKCGMIGTRTQLYRHLAYANRVCVGNIEFYAVHGEVPLNEDKGDEFLNAKWLEGTPKGYND